MPIAILTRDPVTRKVGRRDITDLERSCLTSTDLFRGATWDSAKGRLHLDAATSSAVFRKSLALSGGGSTNVQRKRARSSSTSRDLTDGGDEEDVDDTATIPDSEAEAGADMEVDGSSEESAGSSYDSDADEDADDESQSRMSGIPVDHPRRPLPVLRHLRYEFTEIGW